MRHLVFIFIISSLFFTAVLHFAGQWLHRHQLQSLEMETKLLHQTVEEAIRENFTIIKEISTIAAGYFDTEEIDERRYRKMGESLLTVYPEMLGLNIMDKNGVIIRVHPYETNKLALGKQSQNYKTLKSNFDHGQKFWLSPPFQLYQNHPGFVFYRAVGDGNNHKGWVALVVSYERFFKRFRLSKYLDKYHLVVLDLETNRDFFSTTSLQKIQGEVWRRESDFFGRKVAFLSTPRQMPISYNKSLLFCFAVSTLFSGLTVYAYKQRRSFRESKRKLSHVNALLSLSTSEATQVLKTIDNELKTPQGPEMLKEKISGYTFYLEDLFQQFSVTNTLSRPNISSQLIPLDILPMLEEQLGFFEEIMKRKNLVMEMAGIQGEYIIPAHRWLLCHSGLGNVLRYMTNVAEKGSVIRVLVASVEDKHMISFHADTSEGKFVEGKDAMMDILFRGLKIAQEVFSLHHISMNFLERDREKIITLTLPPR